MPAPLVAIHCITYNHEPYIRDALEGFVMQQTDFPFVAIVHDDASTDGTAAIIREYAEKYPDIIKPIFESENQYSKHDGSLGRIMNQACDETGAKYIALCEGDDYWTDPLKLQKQVDFLETHPEYSMVFANAISHWEDGSKPDSQFSKIENRDYKSVEFVENWIVPTASVVFRPDAVYNDRRYQFLISSGKIIAGDILLFVTNGYNGKVRGMSDVMSVYRRVQTGAVISVIDKQQYRFLVHEIALGKTFGGEILKIFKRKVAVKGIECILGIRQVKSNKLKYILRAFWFSPFETICLILKFGLKLR